MRRTKSSVCYVFIAITFHCTLYQSGRVCILFLHYARYCAHSINQLLTNNTSSEILSLSSLLKISLICKYTGGSISIILPVLVYCVDFSVCVYLTKWSAFKDALKRIANCSNAALCIPVFRRQIGPQCNSNCPFLSIKKLLHNIW